MKKKYVIILSLILVAAVLAFFISLLDEESEVVQVYRYFIESEASASDYFYTDVDNIFEIINRVEERYQENQAP